MTDGSNGSDGGEQALRRAEQAAGGSHPHREHGIELEFWFDPSCPFTWRTSTWLREVAGRHGLRAQWNLMSLTVLNEGNDVPEEHRDGMERAVRLLRVLAAAQDHGGSPAVCRLYEALGTRWHDQGRTPDDGVVREALAEADLPAGLADAADDAARDDAVRASHDRGQARVGTGVGSPVLAVRGGRGFFGPVVVPPPTGDEADRLLEAMRLLGSVPSFSELKSARAEF